MAGMLLFLLADIWMLIRGPRADSAFFIFRSPLIFYPILIIGVLAAGWFVVYALRQLSRPKPLLSLTGESARVRILWMEFQAPWHAFSGYRRKDNNTLLLLMHDPEAFIAAQTDARTQQAARRLLQSQGSPFFIELKQMEADPAAVEQYVAARLPQA